MKTKHALKSKEIWLSFGVIINAVLLQFGLPAIPMTPEIVGAIGIIFLALRSFYTQSKVVWLAK